MKDFWAQLVDLDGLSPVIADLQKRYAMERGDSRFGDEGEEPPPTIIKEIACRKRHGSVDFILERPVGGISYEATLRIPTFVLANLNPDIEDIPKILAQPFLMDADHVYARTWEAVLRKLLAERLS